MVARLTQFDGAPHCSGMPPVKGLLASESVFREVRARPSWAGRGPEILLEDRSSFWREGKAPACDQADGRPPTRPHEVRDLRREPAATVSSGGKKGHRNS